MKSNNSIENELPQSIKKATETNNKFLTLSSENIREHFTSPQSAFLNNTSFKSIKRWDPSKLRDKDYGTGKRVSSHKESVEKSMLTLLSQDIGSPIFKSSSKRMTPISSKNKGFNKVISTEEGFYLKKVPKLNMNTSEVCSSKSLMNPTGSARISSKTKQTFSAQRLVSTKSQRAQLGSSDKKQAQRKEREEFEEMKRVLESVTGRKSSRDKKYYNEYMKGDNFLKDSEETSKPEEKAREFQSIKEVLLEFLSKQGEGSQTLAAARHLIQVLSILFERSFDFKMLFLKDELALSGVLEAMRFIKITLFKLSEKIKGDLSMIQSKDALLDGYKDKVIEARHLRYKEFSNDIEGMRIKLQRHMEEFESKEHRWDTERSAYENKIKSLNERLRALETEKDSEQIRNQMKKRMEIDAKNISALFQQLEDAKTNIAKYEMFSKFYSKGMENMYQEYTNIIYENKQLQTKIEDLNSIKEKVDMYREIAFMSQEDADAYKVSFMSRVKDLQLFYERHQKLSEKLNRFSLNQERPTQIRDDKGDELLETVSRFFLKLDRLFYRNVVNLENYSSLIPNYLEKQPASELERKKAEKVPKLLQISGAEHVELYKFNLHKPAFYAFLEDKYTRTLEKVESEKKNSKFVQNAPEAASVKEFKEMPKTLFFITLRGIFDCKWNEILFYDNPRLNSRFPDFVYSWLGKFKVSSRSRKIISSELTTKVIDADVVRCLFLKNLSHPICNKNWESVIFKEFLEEKGSSDELYFFLYCRNILFQGPQLSRNLGCYSFLHFVSFMAAENLIDTILANYGNEFSNAIKRSLRERIVAKNGRNFIDSGFVLRVLLEFYRNERRNRYRAIQSVFLREYIHSKGVLATSSRVSIGFSAFSIVIDNISPGTSELEKAELYRESWNIGQGAVDADSFFTAATERGFFIKTLKLKMPIKMPTIYSDKEFVSGNAENIDLEDESALRMIREFQNNERSIQELNQLAFSFGIEEIGDQLYKYFSFFKNDLHMDITDLKGKNFIYLYFRYQQILRSVRDFQIYQKCFTKEISEEDAVQMDNEHFTSLFYLVNFEKEKRKLRELELNSKARKIQKWAKQRFSKWYKMVVNLFEVGLKKKRPDMKRNALLAVNEKPKRK